MWSRTSINGLLRGVLLAAVAAFSQAQSTAAGPLAWTFSKIADSHDGFADFDAFPSPGALGGVAPSINDRGVVAFSATTQSGAQGVFVGTGAGSLTSISTSSVGGFDGFVGPTSFAKTGAVGFLASGAHRGYFASDGITTSLIARAPTFSGFFGAPTINDVGQAAFAAQTTPTSPIAVYKSGGGETYTVVAQSSGVFSSVGSPAINNAGATVFSGTLTDGRKGIFVGQGAENALTDYTTVITGTFGNAFSGFFGPDINRSGNVAFSMRADSGFQAVFKTDGGTATQVVNSLGPYREFLSTAIDNSGQVVFYALTDAGKVGVFNGPNTASNKLIATGDTFMGSTVTNLAFGGNGYNNHGQAAFYAKLANGTSGVYRADLQGPSKEDILNNAVLLSPTGNEMFATFTPGMGLSLGTAARLMGFDHFNWHQTAIRYPGGFCRTPTIAGTRVAVSFTDPIPGGCLNPDHSADTLPFYWDEEQGPALDPDYHLLAEDITVGDRTLVFSDIPKNAIPLGLLDDYMEFVTALAGVRADGTWEPLYTFSWKSTGWRFGGGDVTARDVEPGGFGEIFDAFAFTGLENVPLEVREIWLAEGATGVPLAAVDSPPISAAVLALGLAAAAWRRRRSLEPSGPSQKPRPQ